MCIMRLNLFFILLSFLTLDFCVAIYNLTETKPGCQPKCGNLDIPYPFGIGANCFFARWTEVICNTTFNPPKPFFRDGRIEIAQLSATEIRIKNRLAQSCYNKSGAITKNTVSSFDLTRTPYTFSSKNKLFAVGCDTTVSDTNYNGTTSFSSYSICEKGQKVVEGSCSGFGCDEVSIPNGLNKIDAQMISTDNYTKVPSSYGTCGSGFLAEKDKYSFKISDFTNTTSLIDVPIVLDFVITNETCQQAKRNSKTYACKGNSYCYDSVEGTGYLCSCNKGYEGNPYIDQSCQDVNECEDSSNTRCKGICINTQGSYYCSCSSSSKGDGAKNGTGCPKKYRKVPVLELTLGVGLGILFLLIGLFCLRLNRKERELLRQKDMFFKQNGGLLLKQQISSHESGVSVKIFTSEELKMATDNYNQDRILGQGGSGTVYKGILADFSIVAVKMSRMVYESQLGQFINEVIILTQINHRNVVQLLGCCLETEVPILVYEFVANGTLFHHLHMRSGESTVLSWQDRLRISAETAVALSYLHFAASTPIFHRDVKSANIILDENYTAKVADFGASRLNALDQTQISTIVQGTMGYLDPAYFRNGQLTEKSDVYSFGVVLVELLTGKKAVSFERSLEQRHLATYFVLSMEDNCLIQLLEATIVNMGDMEQIQAVAVLAKKCLCVNSHDRPSMKDVAMELQGLRGYRKRQLLANNIGVTSDHVDLYDIPSSEIYNSDASSTQCTSKAVIMESMNVLR